MKILMALAVVLGLSATVSAAEVGDTVPCVTLNNVYPDGSEKVECIHGEGGISVVEFFQVNCGPCRRNLPTFSALATDLAGQASFRMVGIDRKESMTRDYMSQRAEFFHFPVALDTNRKATKAFKIPGTPTLFIINAQDEVIYKHVGGLRPQDVADITALLGGQN